MGTTPEGKVKQKVRGILDQYPSMYYYMPVPTGYGRVSLDFIGCYNRLFFAVETKADGGKLTHRQKMTIAEMQLAGAVVFVLTGTVDLAYAELIGWLELNRPTSHDNTHQSPAQGYRRPL